MKITSKFNDQGGEQFKDRYWGDVPMFLKYIPEAEVCIPNPDFIDLYYGLEAWMLGGTAKKSKHPRPEAINPKNISKVMMDKFKIIIEIMADPSLQCAVDPEYALIVAVINGNDSPCEGAARCMVDCDELVCCNATFKCSCI